VALTDVAITKIKNMIVSGELGPGDRLPAEADLAERLGLSRNSLRESVKALALMNVLDVRQGDGTYVTTLQTQALMSAVEFVLDFQRDDTVLQFLEVRRILEPAATAMAASSMTLEGIEALTAHLDSADPHGSVEDLVRSDLTFHRMIALGAGNQVLCSLLDSLAGPIQRARVWRGLTQSGAVERTMAEHREIVAAIASGRQDIARSWATVHVAGVELWLRQALEGEGTTPGT
jgi:GntR family transcriptional regulator, transcriptional repressor for pyruvate dehydrogenase complex